MVGRLRDRFEPRLFRIAPSGSGFGSDASRLPFCPALVLATLPLLERRISLPYACLLSRQGARRTGGVPL